MNSTDLKLKKAVQKQLEKTINEALNTVRNDIEKETLEIKMDKLSGELTEAHGHMRLDTSDVLMNMLADSIMTKIQKSKNQSIEDVLKEEVATIVEGALDGLRRIK
mgnify:CR=1 FL=1